MNCAKTARRPRRWTRPPRVAQGFGAISTAVERARDEETSKGGGGQAGQGATGALDGWLPARPRARSLHATLVNQAVFWRGVSCSCRWCARLLTSASYEEFRSSSACSSASVVVSATPLGTWAALRLVNPSRTQGLRAHVGVFERDSVADRRCASTVVVATTQRIAAFVRR